MKKQITIATLAALCIFGITACQEKGKTKTAANDATTTVTTADATATTPATEQVADASTNNMVLPVSMDATSTTTDSSTVQNTTTTVAQGEAPPMQQATPDTSIPTIAPSQEAPAAPAMALAAPAAATTTPAE
jgi:hypothetical protein